MNPWNATNAESDMPLERSERDTTFISALSRCHICHVLPEKGGLDAVMTPDFSSHGQRPAVLPGPGDDAAKQVGGVG